MTEAKRPWTAGPWLMRKADGYGNVFEIGLSKFGHERLGLSGVRDNSYMYVHGSMNEADARLISAAPDMAEALVDVSGKAMGLVMFLSSLSASDPDDRSLRDKALAVEASVDRALDALRKAGMEGV